MCPPHGLRGWLWLAPQFRLGVLAEARKAPIRDAIGQLHGNVKVPRQNVVNRATHARELLPTFEDALADIGGRPDESGAAP
jgi:hypothetical protein